MLPLDALLLDFETKSRSNLKKEGLAKYIHDPSTEVHCAAYLCPHTMQSSLWLPGQPVPDFSDKIIYGWNVQFEKVIWELILKWPAPKGWYDIAARCRYAGCPGMLETACHWFGLSDELKKMEIGTSLIDLLCKPIKTNSKKKGEVKGEFRTPEKYPELFQQLYAYCAQDNVAALAIMKLLPPWPQMEQDIWQMTVAQNERGCPIDVDLCNAVVSLTEQLLARAKDIVFKATNEAVVSPTQVGALTTWLQEQGVNIDDLTKETVAKLLDETRPEYHKMPKAVIDVLKARQVGAPASIKKFRSSLDKHINDRLYHNFIYCGAAATGRWTCGGKDEDSDSVQLQNLRRGTQTEEMLEIIKMGDADVLTAISANPIKELQDSVRSMIHAG